MNMRSLQEQLEGLLQLSKLIGRSECSTGIYQQPGDVAYLMAIETPGASQIVYAVGGYDVWCNELTKDNKLFGGRNLQASNLSLEDAAKVVVTEYHLAKAARIKAHSPHLSVDEIMATLTKGYQKKSNLTK